MLFLNSYFKIFKLNKYLIKTLLLISKTLIISIITKYIKIN